MRLTSPSARDTRILTASTKHIAGSCLIPLEEQYGDKERDHERIPVEY